MLVALLTVAAVRQQAAAVIGHQKQSSSLPHDSVTKQKEWGEVCRFYSQSPSQMEVEMRGSDTGVCAGPKWHTWWQRATSLCVSCFDRGNVCKNPPVLVFHAYLDGLHRRDWRASLAFLKAFLLSQDLRKTRLLLWVTDADELLQHPQAADFFK